MMQTVDIFDLSRGRRTVEGDFTLADLPELGDLLEGDGKSAKVHFEATGTSGALGLPGADLSITATIVTNCVRCTKPVTLEIAKVIPFLFTESEAEADRMPVEEDDEYEIVVGSNQFALQAWVQEELILSLPRFISHEDCEPAEIIEEEPESEKRPNPFACLASLKAKN